MTTFIVNFVMEQQDILMRYKLFGMNEMYYKFVSCNHFLLNYELGEYNFSGGESWKESLWSRRTFYDDPFCGLLKSYAYFYYISRNMEYWIRFAIHRTSSSESYFSHRYTQLHKKQTFILEVWSISYEKWKGRLLVFYWFINDQYCSLKSPI